MRNMSPNLLRMKLVRFDLRFELRFPEKCVSRLNDKRILVLRVRVEDSSWSKKCRFKLWLWAIFGGFTSFQLPIPPQWRRWAIRPLGAVEFLSDQRPNQPPRLSLTRPSACQLHEILEAIHKEWKIPILAQCLGRSCGWEATQHDSHEEHTVSRMYHGCFWDGISSIRFYHQEHLGNLC